MRLVNATRYVAPLREGGSLPAIIEADDDGMYVLKFRAAGQGPKALISELIAGEIARTLGLPVPEIVFVHLDPVLGRSEPDPEIQQLIKNSAGLNLALDYLPGALAFASTDIDHVGAGLASSIVWLDSYVTNVDRTARNTNLLLWHKQLMLIDHGAALYFHHNWPTYRDSTRSAFGAIKDHVLLRAAGELANADATAKRALTASKIEEILTLAPAEWLTADPFLSSAEAYRAAYCDYLAERLNSSEIFLQEALNARSRLI